MEFSLRFVISLLIGVMVLFALVVVLQDNAGSLQGFIGDFMTLEAPG